MLQVEEWRPVTAPSQPAAPAATAVRSRQLTWAYAAASVVPHAVFVWRSEGRHQALILGTITRIIDWKSNPSFRKL